MSEFSEAAYELMRAAGDMLESLYDEDKLREFVKRCKNHPNDPVLPIFMDVFGEDVNDLDECTTDMRMQESAQIWAGR